MTNDRLRDAMQNAGLEVDDLADCVEVDPKTIKRWLSGRVPYPRYRGPVARALGVPAHELWPDTEPLPTEEEREEPVRGPGTDLDALHDDSRDPTAPEWLALIGQAKVRIDLLDLTLAHLPAGPGVVAELAARADAGVAVRVLISDPESIHLVISEQEIGRDNLVQSSPTALAAERTIGYLQPLLDHPRVDVRMFVAPTPSAILRVDDRMLVALHLHGAAPDTEPVLALTRRTDHGIFARYAHHLDQIATHAAAPLTADPERYPDPTQHPDRYEFSDDFTAPRYGAFGPEPRPVTTTASSEPKPRWRRQR